MGYFAGFLSGVIVFYLYKNGHLNVIIEEGKRHLTVIIEEGKKLFDKVFYK